MKRRPEKVLISFKQTSLRLRSTVPNSEVDIVLTLVHYESEKILFQDHFLKEN